MGRLRLPFRLIILTVTVTALFWVSGGRQDSQAGVGFRVPVSTTLVMGQAGKVLLFQATEVDGGSEAIVACVPIDAGVFDPPLLYLKELLPGQNPCDQGLPDAFIPPVTLTITAGVYVGGEQTAEKQVSTTVDFEDDSRWWILDGAALSADTAGDADCNRKTNAVDALHVLRSVASLGDTACLQAANVKCDDGTTAVDALLILRHVAALSLNLPQGCPSPFPAPVLVSPEDGAHLGPIDIPQADLTWDAVAGAPKYSVQVDCAGCCAGGQYCSDVGRGYPILAAVTDDAYTAGLPGANLERWRVWVINDDGTPGDFSEFRTFDLHAPPAASR